MACVGAADLRPRLGRERALSARSRDRARIGAGAARPSPGRHRDPHDGLPERLRPARISRRSGFVGRGPGTYNLYLGRRLRRTRLNKLYRKDVGHEAIVAALSPLFAAYAAERNGRRALLGLRHPLRGGQANHGRQCLPRGCGAGTGRLTIGTRLAEFRGNARRGHRIAAAAGRFPAGSCPSRPSRGAALARRGGDRGRAAYTTPLRGLAAALARRRRLGYPA